MYVINVPLHVEIISYLVRSMEDQWGLDQWGDQWGDQWRDQWRINGVTDQWGQTRMPLS